MSGSVVLSLGSLGTLVSDVEGSLLDDVEGSHGPHEQAQYSGPHMAQ